MALTHTDMPLAELRAYRPELPAPPNLAGFWRDTLDAARATASAPSRAVLEGPITELIVEDLTFAGFGGEPIRAWITRPRRDEPLPAVVEFVGYGGGRGLPGEHLAWAAAGFVHVLMDTRGQGSGWGNGGDTPDAAGSAPATPGFMTRGIRTPDDYYFRRVYTDGVRLVETVAEFAEVDATRIAVTGTSQGGGISIAVAALSDIPSAAMPNVPFLCDFPRSIVATPSAPFTEITRYLSVHRDAVDEVLTTLSYFDGAVLARTLSAPALFSVGLMDEVVLPSSVFAAFQATAATDKHIEVYGFNGHEGGGFRHWQRCVDWLGTRFAVR